MSYTGTIAIHRDTETGNYPESPLVRISLTANDITRSGSTISCKVSASLLSLNSSLSYFGYAIKVYVQLDNGSMSNAVFSKPSYPSQWSDNAYSGSVTIQSTNTTTSATLYIYAGIECTCYYYDSTPRLVATRTLEAPAADATVTFNPKNGTWSDGTTSNKTVTVSIGNTATITAPTRTNYTFTGWNSKSDGTGTNYGTSGVSNVQSSMTVYAQWEIIKYTVTYNANNGTTESYSESVNSGTTYSIKDITDNKLGFTNPTYTLTFDAQGGTVNGYSKYSVPLDRPFSSWNTKADGTGTTYTVGKSYSISSAITLYAIWGSPEIGTLYTPVYENTEFIGWFDGTGVNANQVYETTKVTANNTTIYAHYNYYVVYYYNTAGSSSGDYDPDDDPDMGTDLGVFTSGIKSYGIAYAIISDYPKNIPEKEFASWNTDPEGLGTRYIAGDSYTEDAPLNLYARYDLGKYTVIFDANKGQFNDGSSQKKYTNVEAGSGVTPPEDPTRKGHKFLGWLGNYSKIVQDTTVKAMWSYYPIWIRNKDNEWEGYR